MPSPIGHALAGTALALAVSRTPQASRRIDWPVVGLFASLAALPDLDLAFMQHRTATHSLVSVAVVTIVAAAVTGQVRRSMARPAVRPIWAVALLCGAAWGSHIVLDWMAADGSVPRGMQVLWPFGDRWFISDWDVFRRLERRDIFVPATIVQNTLAVLQEVALMAPLAWLAAKLRA